MNASESMLLAVAVELRQGEVRRIHLLRGWVNKSYRKGRGCLRNPLTLGPHDSLLGGLYDSGAAPICRIAPSRSYSGHSSTILPLSSKRSICMPLISIRLPVGATPKNSP